MKISCQHSSKKNLSLVLNDYLTERVLGHRGLYLGHPLFPGKFRAMYYTYWVSEPKQSKTPHTHTLPTHNTHSNANNPTWTNKVKHLMQSFSVVYQMVSLSRVLLVCFLDDYLAFYCFKRCISEIPTTMKLAMRARNRMPWLAHWPEKTGGFQLEFIDNRLERESTVVDSRSRRMENLAVARNQKMRGDSQ